jgi:hypothetical protein
MSSSLKPNPSSPDFKSEKNMKSKLHSKSYLLENEFNSLENYCVPSFSIMPIIPYSFYKT